MPQYWEQVLVIQQAQVQARVQVSEQVEVAVYHAVQEQAPERVPVMGVEEGPGEDSVPGQGCATHMHQSIHQRMCTTESVRS